MRSTIRYQSQLLFRRSYAAFRLMPRGGLESLRFLENPQSRRLRTRHNSSDLAPTAFHAGGEEIKNE